MEHNRSANVKYGGLIKNTFIFGIGLIGSKFVQFILLPYFTNVLTKDEYGTIDLSITFVGLMVPLLTLELSDSVLRFTLSEDTNKKALVTNASIVLIVATAAALLFSPLLHFYRTIADYRWFIVMLVITQAFRTNSALFVKASNKVKIYSIDSILTAAVVASFDIIFITFLKMSVNGYLLAEILGNCSSFIFLFFYGRIKTYLDYKNNVDLQLMKRMLKYSIPLMFNAISWWITSFSDRMILDMFFSTDEVGIYSVASKIPAIVTTVLSVFTQAWIMSAVREYESDKDVRFFENVYTLFSSALFLFVSIVILIVKPVMRVYVGKEFFEAWYYVPLLLIASVFLGISNYYGAIYASAKANILEIKSTIICAISNILLNLVLIPKLNILGAVLATALSYVIVVVVRMIDTRRIILLNIRIRGVVLVGALLITECILVMREKMMLASGVCILIIICHTIILIRHGFFDKVLQFIKK